MKILNQAEIEIISGGSICPESITEMNNFIARTNAIATTMMVGATLLTCSAWAALPLAIPGYFSVAYFADIIPGLSPC